MHAFIDLSAQARDLTLADPAHAHRLDQLVHRTGGDALHIGLLDHCSQRLLRRAPRLKKSGKVAALAQLRDLQIDRAGACLPGPLTIAVAAVQALSASLAIPGCAQALNVHLHHALGDVLDHLLEQIRIRTLFGELRQCHSRLGGHRVVLSEVKCGNSTLPRLTMAAASSGQRLALTPPSGTRSMVTTGVPFVEPRVHRM